MSTAPGAPNSQVRPGAKMPPKASPNTQTTSPQPALASPASRDSGPRAAVSIHRPIPTWIHTAEAPACIGWYDQVVPPTFTRRCTHCGEAAARGSMTCDGSPIAILGWACKIPSKTHSRPKPMRSSRRQAGSARAGPGAAGAAGVQVRTVTQASPNIAKISSAISPWCTSAALNAATTAGSLTLSPEFIPGMAVLPRAARCRPRQRGRVLARPAAGRGRAGR